MFENLSAETRVLSHWQKNKKILFDYVYFSNHAFKFHVLSLKNKLQKCIRKFCFSQLTFENSLKLWNQNISVRLILAPNAPKALIIRQESHQIITKIWDSLELPLNRFFKQMHANFPCFPQKMIIIDTSEIL